MIDNKVLARQSRWRLGRIQATTRPFPVAIFLSWLRTGGAEHDADPSARAAGARIGAIDQPELRLMIAAHEG